MGDELNAIFAQQQLRHELGIPLSATVLLSVGEVNRNKNHQLCITALAQLHKTNLYYVICGSGNLLEKNKLLAKKLGVEKQVIFTGYRKDVAIFYHMADLFLFPSYREGLPVAVMEAMASGLPVVATRIRGSSDLVQQGDLFEPTDVVGIAKAIETPQQSNAKHETAVFDIHKVMESMKTIYEIEI